jgi:hypothetical protein
MRELERDHAGDDQRGAEPAPEARGIAEKPHPDQKGSGGADAGPHRVGGAERDVPLRQKKSKPPLIASEMTAIAAPTTVRPGSCVHFSPIGQPTSHSPAAIRYAQAIATSCASSLCDSRNHSEGRFQIRDSANAGQGQAGVAAPVARGAAAPPPFWLDTLKLRGSL